MDIDLSIIIVNYNTKEVTLACIDSILKCNLKVKFEIVLVDNGSSDGSEEFFRKIQGDKLRVIYHKKNLGFSRANNSALKKAVGKYVLLLNSDTVVKRGAVEILLEFAKHTPLVGIVAPRLLNQDGSLQASAYHLPSVRGAFEEFWLGRKGAFEKYIPRTLKPIEVEAVVAAAMLITPIALKKVGVLNEKYFMYFEDLDYCRAVGKAGLKIYYHPDAEITHLHGASGKSLADKDNQWRRLIPSSKIYHGLLKHTVINLVIWGGQKWQKLRG